MSTKQDQREFTWPPRPIPAEGPKPLSPPVAAARIASARPSLLHRVTELWVEFERAWLDPIAEPLPRRAAHVGWAPDEPSRYCERCGHDAGPHESADFGCARCHELPLPWDRFVRLGRYEPPLEDWICEVKFTQFRSLGTALGRWLGARLRDAGALSAVAAPSGARPNDHVVVVPIPASLPRRLYRGVDHAQVIARGVAAELGVRVAHPLRRRHRPSQRSVPLSSRGRNVAGSFVLKRRADLSGRLVILIDDVATTGATMRAAGLALRGGHPGRTLPNGPAAIWAAAAAVTPEPARPGPQTVPE